MADRLLWYFEQLVSSLELRESQDKLEASIRNLSIDIEMFGAISGLEGAETSGTPDLNVTVSAGVGYDQQGRRLNVATAQVLDMSQDLNGLPTEPSSGANTRWTSAFLRFATTEATPRIDGNSQLVNLRSFESFELVVRMGAEAPSPTRPALRADEILLFDVHRISGQTQILDGDIDVTRRQSIQFLSADRVPVDGAGWSQLDTASVHVQDALDSADNVLEQHFTGAADNHDAADIVVDPGALAQLAGTDVQAVIAELDTHIDGSALKHAAAAVTVATGALAQLAGTDVQAAIAEIDTHIDGSALKHAAGDVTSSAYSYLASTNVQAALQEIVDDLATQAVGTPGAERIGIDGLAGAVFSTVAESLRSFGIDLLSFVNTNAQRMNADHFGEGSTQENGHHHHLQWDMADDANSIKKLATGGVEQAAGSPRVRIFFFPSLLEPRLIFTLNADFNGTNWVADNAGASVVAAKCELEIDTTGPSVFLRICMKDGTASAWSDSAWDNTVIVGGDTGALNLNTAQHGDNVERGAMALAGKNFSGSAATIFDMIGLNFKGYFRLGAPASVVLTNTTSLNWTTTPNVTNIADYGCRIEGTSDSTSAGGNAHWFGRYDATQ